MVRQSPGTIPIFVLSLAARFLELKRLDLCNKSCMTGDRHVQFCERLGVKFPLPTRPTGVRIQGF